MREGNTHTHTAECPFWSKPTQKQINQYNTYFSLAFAREFERANLCHQSLKCHLPVKDEAISKSLSALYMQKQYFVFAFGKKRALFSAVSSALTPIPSLSIRIRRLRMGQQTNITPYSTFRTMLTKRRFERDFQTI